MPVGLPTVAVGSVVAVLWVLAALAMKVTLTATMARAVNNDGNSPFVTCNMHGSDIGMAWRSEI
ncbi:hypothetical protein GCM10010326_65680 [Streptomyces xanthochromogenes]|uniref:Uncharacterized protein n=1 Tax=Streptomyces xanthochromogenes TaxID=67384 RepID=A0ABQ3AQP5_9ACTN|nr:hypothetical protein GCM10010326_65680 [Streptomyces xanthochromogenes]